MRAFIVIPAKAGIQWFSMNKNRRQPKAPADGYTIWIGQTANLAIGPALKKKSPYDPARDFAPITLVQKASSALVVSASSPLKSLDDLIAFAKKAPGTVTYGSAGIGSGGHIKAYFVRNGVASSGCSSQ